MRFVYPPRPRGRIEPVRLPEYEASANPTWWAQWKYKGTRCLTYVTEDRLVRFYKWTGEPHRAYSPTDQTVENFRSLGLEAGKGYVLDGELMHSQTKTIKDVVVLYDVLWAGDYLFGTTVRDRLAILSRVCGEPTVMEPTGRAYAVREHIWLAPTFTDGFARRFAEAVPDDAREGLVLKQPDGRIDNMGGREHEVAWQVRCRKSHKNYSH